MLHAAIRDLVHRRRRYLISMVGCGLVFAMSLLMTGIADAFTVGWYRTVDALGVDGFVVPDGASGPFAGANPFPADDLPDGAEPFVYAIQSAFGAPAPDGEVVAVFGIEPGGPLEPTSADGRGLEGDGEALVSDHSAFDVGDTATIGGRQIVVVGTITQMNVNGGMAGMVLSIEDARDIVFGGLPLVSAGGIVSGAARPDPPDELAVVSTDEAIDGALRMLESARGAIGFMRALLLVVAALIVASVIFLSVLERLRDFAVFKTIGTSTGAIAGGVVFQSSAFALGSALIGVVLGNLLAPFFPMPIVLTGVAMVVLLLLGLVVGVLASLAGLSRALRVQPALAFGGAA